MPRRPADVFAGKGSFAGKLKARRASMEAGDASGGRSKATKPAKKKKKIAKKRAVKKSENSRTLRDVLLSKAPKDKRDPMRRGQ